VDRDTRDAAGRLADPSTRRAAIDPSDERRCRSCPDADHPTTTNAMKTKLQKKAAAPSPSRENEPVH